jgi:hypothetical protein
MLLSTRAKVMTKYARSLVTLQEAKSMPKDYNEFSNDVLLSMVANNDQSAKEERLIREIMAVDNIEWSAAHSVFLEMVRENRKGLGFATLPYKIGVLSAVTAGIASLPLVFDYNTVIWFNDAFVTTDVPEAKDLETPLEVGAWAWNWMEPPLGQISFFLLCMQFARAQLQNLDMKPYTEYVRSSRAKRLCNAFPRYDADVVSAFSEGDSFGGGSVTENKTNKKK